MKKHTTKLIEGKFSHSKAKSLLTELLSYKINYHQLRKFSNEERFGRDCEHSENRITELTKEKQELTEWLNSLENTDTVNILCNINMQALTMESKNSDNKFFFICPFCQIEHFIRKHFGNVYFITAPASIFSFDDEEFALEIRDFIARRNIDEIYFVCDLDCNFVGDALSGGSTHGLSCERVIQNLMSSSDTSFTISQKIILNQINAIKNTKGISDLIIDRKVKLQGIITSKKENKLFPHSIII